MKIFNDSAFISAEAAKNYATVMMRTDPGHMGPVDSPYFVKPNKILELEEKIGAQGVTRSGTFERAMLQALDKVSDTQQFASVLAKEAILNPDSVDIHDVTIAQAEASMSFGITRNILNRLVQSWKDIINTR
jgi:flagellar hook-basal body complex protein FliE